MYWVEQSFWSSLKESRWSSLRLASRDMCGQTFGLRLLQEDTCLPVIFLSCAVMVFFFFNENL